VLVIQNSIYNISNFAVHVENISSLERSRLGTIFYDNVRVFPMTSFASTDVLVHSKIDTLLQLYYN
jgi:hypothetical protein